MQRLTIGALALIACSGKKEQPPPDKTPPADAATAGIDAIAAKAPVAIDAPAPADAAVIANSLAGKEPPTTESVHVELGHAVRRWMANPRDRGLYAKDFT